jgi:arylsulfatase A-like enzyme
MDFKTAYKQRDQALVEEEPSHRKCRRSFVKARDVITALVLCGIFALMTQAVAFADEAPRNKPNVIFILADDLSYWDLSCFGQKQFSTPNIDRLASQGRVFSNAYAGGPWCAPSRTALLTGLNGTHATPLATDANGRGTKFNPTVAQLLKSAGYVTCALGKWHMQEPNESWFFGKQTREEQRKAENQAEMPWNRGFDVCRIGYSFGLNPHYPHQLETGDDTEIAIPQNADVDDDYMSKNYRSPVMYDSSGRFVDKSGHDSTHLAYAEDLYRDEALKFIRDNQSKPFFLYYATPLMHGPLAVKDLGEFKDKPAPWTQAHKLWAGEAKELDKSVGIIVDAVKQLGLDKNTIIFFASDNGYSEWGYFGRKAWSDDPVFQNKGPWNRGKFINTNGGVIVPFIAWGPGLISPGKTDRAINLFDFMATASEMASAKLPGPTDGVSFVPLLQGRDRDQPLRSIMFWPQSSDYGIEIPDDFALADTTEKYLPPSALLDERWYALEFKPKSKALQPTIRLFDIKTDPGCKEDLSAQHKDLCDRAAAAFK